MGPDLQGGPELRLGGPRRRAAGNPMPALARLPYMVVELAVFALISGAFSKLSSKNPLFAFVGAILAILGAVVCFFKGSIAKAFDK